MAASPVDVVRAFFETPDMRADLLDPDVEFLPLTHDQVFGPAGVLRILDDIAEHFRDYDVRAAELVPIDEEHVLVRLERTGLTHQSDLPITDHFAQIFSVRAGRIARMESFKTPEEALDSLG
jgi:ketosteroid isomerase-like protein